MLNKGVESAKFKRELVSSIGRLIVKLQTAKEKLEPNVYSKIEVQVIALNSVLLDLRSSVEYVERKRSMY
jgi:hypothetical protein